MIHMEGRKKIDTPTDKAEKMQETVEEKSTGTKKKAPTPKKRKAQSAPAKDVKEKSNVSESVTAKEKPKDKKLVKIGTEQHALVKNKQLTLCYPVETVRVTIENLGGGDVLVQSPTPAKLFSGGIINIDTNENLVLYSHSFPKVSVTYWRD